MHKLILTYILLILLVPLAGQSQTSVTPGVQAYSYYHPSKDKESWQRLNLQLSTMFMVVAKEGDVQHDTCLYMAGRSLGLSRVAVLAEGISDKELMGQSQWIDQQQPGMGVHLLSTAKGTKHLQLLVLLASYYAFQPRSYYRYRDSVEYFVGKAINEGRLLKEDRLGRQALCLLGKIYVQASDNKGDSIFNLLINECRQAGDKETEVKAIAYRGIYAAPTQTSFQQKITDLQAAADLYNKLGNKEGEINVLMGLGYMLVVTGQFANADEILLKAFALAGAIRYPYTHYITEALATANSFQGKFGEPFRYALQTVKVAERCKDSIGWGYFYSQLSDFYYSEGRDKECFDLAQKAVKRFVEDRNLSVYGILNTVIDYTHSEGRAKEALELTLDISRKVGIPNIPSDIFSYYYAFAGCYLHLNRPDRAEAYAQKMDSLETEAEKTRGPLRRSLITGLYGHIFLKRGQYQKAREYFEKQFTTISYGQRALINDLITYRSLLSIDSILGDNVSGVAHYKKYTQLLDSNFKVTKIRQAEELQVLYETQEKEIHIAALNQQAGLEKANARQATLVKNLTLLGIVAVIVIAGLLYRQNRLKQRNNTVITGKNEELQHLLTDKEWLLKEVHHRVKNNLQIVMSLLHSQSVYINNDAALTAIHDSRRRVYAMSLIHQKLYQSENISTIPMPGYISELVNHIQDSFNCGNQVIFNQDIEPLDLDVSQAIPLGLIINECIVNAVKYAFPGEQKGIVNISLQHDGDDYLLLNISDNGVGLPVGLNVMEHNSLGLDLVRGLATQLNGSVNIVSNNGLQVIAGFPVMSKQILGETLVNS